MSFLYNAEKSYKHSWHYSKFSLMCGKNKNRSIFWYCRLYLWDIFKYSARFTLGRSCKRGCSQVRIMLSFCLDADGEEPNNFYQEKWTTPHFTRFSVGGKRTWPNIVPQSLAERVWWTKFQSSLLNFYFHLSGSFLFASAKVRILVHITPKCGTEPIWYVTIQFQDRRGAAFIPYRNRTAPSKAIRHSLQWWTTPWRITECYSMILY